MARYIDADRLLNEVTGNGGVFVYGIDTIKAFISRITAQPTADVQEVKHGEWVAVPSSDMSTGKAYKCSECQKMRYGVRLPPYCQECGAKMDGGKNE